jgi:NMD protein affecting ribosome stability and mRNA decay
MAKCRGCGAPIIERFAELAGGLCPSCARKATTPGQEIPANVKRIATTQETVAPRVRAKPQAESSEHERNVHVHSTGTAERARSVAPSSEHLGATATVETASESLSEHIGFRVTPTMDAQLRNAAQVKSTSVPCLIREAIRALLEGETRA